MNLFESIAAFFEDMNTKRVWVTILVTFLISLVLCTVTVYLVWNVSHLHRPLGAGPLSFWQCVAAGFVAQVTVRPIRLQFAPPAF